MHRRGFFGIGVFNPLFEENLGTLMRSAYAFDADFAFTIGGRYKYQASDTCKGFKHVPTYQYTDFPDFLAHLPQGCALVGVEIDERAKMLSNVRHPERAVYLLGSEKAGLSPEQRIACDVLIKIPSKICLNVSVTGSIVLYDRIAKLQ